MVYGDRNWQRDYFINRKKYEETQKKLNEMPEASWITEGRKFYAEHRYYPPGFITRVFGDPNEHVTVPTSEEEFREKFLKRVA